MTNTTRHGVRTLLVLLTLFSLLALVGCASGGGGGGAGAKAAAKGPSDEELITGMIDKVTEALAAQDIDTMASFYADDFVDSQGQDKATMVGFLNGVKEQGFLEGVEIDHANRTMNIDGDTAKVEGIGLSGAFGVLTLGFDLEKRDGTWVVTGQTQE